MPTNASQTPDARQQLDATLGALEGGVTALSPAAARSTIERWLNTLAERDDLNDVATALGELRAALASPPFDGPAIGRILRRLGERTTAAADRADDKTVASKLERLGSVLARAGTALTRGDTAGPQAGTADQPGVVQERSTAHGPMPQGPDGSNADLDDVGPNRPSETPGTKFDPK